MANINMTYKDNKLYFCDISKRLESQVEDLIEDTAQNIESDAIVAASRDSSKLASSINMESKGLEAEITSKADYSPYVEFGTGGEVDVPKGMDDYAIQFKGQGLKKVSLIARPFLFPAWRENGLKMMNRLKNLINGN